MATRRRPWRRWQLVKNSKSLSLIVCITATGLLVPLGLLTVSSWGSAPHDVVSLVPLGSNLNELNQYLKRGRGSTGEVVEWIPTASSQSVARDVVKNEFGMFVKKNLGSYDEWKASARERDQFTGQITFIHHGSTSSDANTFIYHKGKLRKKDWGFLPG